MERRGGGEGSVKVRQKRGRVGGRRGRVGGGETKKDIPQRGSCGSTSTEAPPVGYTQVLDSQMKRTHPQAVHVTVASVTQRLLLHM